MLQPIELIVDNRRALDDFRRYTMEEVKSITVAQAGDIMDVKRREVACLKPKEMVLQIHLTNGDNVEFPLSEWYFDFTYDNVQDESVKQVFEIPEEYRKEYRPYKKAARGNTPGAVNFY